MEEEENHPEFDHLDPSQMPDETPNKIQKEKVFKPIVIGNIEDLRLQTKDLDKYQKYVVEMAIRFARGAVKALKLKNKRPRHLF